MKLLLLSGSVESILLDKPTFQGMFDLLFLSSRSAHIMGNPLMPSLLCKDSNPVVVVEGSKFVVPINNQTRIDFNNKIQEFADNAGLHKIPGNLILFIFYYYHYYLLSFITVV